MPVERSVRTSGGRIAITDTGGDGPVILFIHGNSSCRAAFRHQFAAAGSRPLRLLAFDLPGHGDSDDAVDPCNTYTVPAYAELTLELIGLLGIVRAAIVGWSLGGHIGLEIMARWPGLAGLLIVGTPPVAPRADALAEAFRAVPQMEFAGKEHLSAAEAMHYGAAIHGGARCLDPRLVAAVLRTDGRARRCMMQAALAGLGFDGRKVAETASVPLAVVSGADEPFVDNEYLKSLNYGSLWRGRIHVLEGAGHAPFLETPAAFDRLLFDFVEDVFRDRIPRPGRGVHRNG